MAVMQQNNIISLNTQGLKSNRVYIESIIKNYQVVYLCEHWLLKAEEYLLKDMVESTHKLFSHLPTKVRLVDLLVGTAS